MFRLADLLLEKVVPKAEASAIAGCVIIYPCCAVWHLYNSTCGCISGDCWN
jgi:hypothetical protein